MQKLSSILKSLALYVEPKTCTSTCSKNQNKVTTGLPRMPRI